MESVLIRDRCGASGEQTKNGSDFRFNRSPRRQTKGREKKVNQTLPDRVPSGSLSMRHSATFARRQPQATV